MDAQPHVDKPRTIHISSRAESGPSAAIQPFLKSLSSLYGELTALGGGEVATYIPELAKADPRDLSVAIATLDGEIYAVGDYDKEFTIQSVSKPFAYAALLDRLGRGEMMSRVGVEPTGEAFNSIVLDDTNRRPFNPMVNAGAITISSLFPGDTLDSRSAAMLATLSRFAGRPLKIDETVFRSEASTGHRNRAIAYLLLNAGMLEVDPEAALDTYFRQCSVLVNTMDLAVMAATFANAGINPRTGERAVLVETIPDVLTVMLTCGMYDYAGQWAFEAGLPAKSGVSGGVIAVVPGQFGIAAYSPKLDRFGNSVRAVEACQKLSSMFSFHSYRQRVSGISIKNREWSCKELRSRRWRPPAERKLLDEHGDRIRALEARGDLSIAATERILRRAGIALAEDRLVILDMKGITGIDAGSARLVAEFGRALIANGKTILLTKPGEQGVIRRLMEDDGRLPSSFMLKDSLDDALEAAENTVLAENGIGAANASLPIEEATLFAGLSADDLAKLVAEVAPEKRPYEPGETVVRQGDATDAVFIIASGIVTVQLPAKNSAPTRISSLGPGAVFGEMGLIDGSPRSADVVAETDAECWVLSIEALQAFLGENPAIKNLVLTNLVKDLSDRLRQSNRMVMSLR